MTRLVKAELLKLRTTRTARTLLALTAAGTAALVALVLLLAGRPGQPELGEDALRQLVLVPAQPLTLAALVLGILGMAGELRHGTATSTFLVTPVRGRVVAAKLATASRHRPGHRPGGLGGGVRRRPALVEGGRGIKVPIAGAGMPATLAGVVAAVAIFGGLIGVGLGALVREQVTGVVGLLVYLFHLAEPIVVTRINRPCTAGPATCPAPPPTPYTQVAQANQRLPPTLDKEYGLVLALPGGRLVARRDLT